VIRTPKDPAALDILALLDALKRQPAEYPQFAARRAAFRQQIAERNDPRTPEQIEMDEWAADWNDTYRSLREDL
jgi:hypothetical protein